MGQRALKQQVVLEDVASTGAGEVSKLECALPLPSLDLSIFRVSRELVQKVDAGPHPPLDPNPGVGPMTSSPGDANLAGSRSPAGAVVLTLCT